MIFRSPIGELGVFVADYSENLRCGAQHKKAIFFCIHFEKKRVSTQCSASAKIMVILS